MPRQKISYARVARSFWTDPDVKRKLTADQKLLLLYYFTNPHGNMIGLYYCPFEYASFETGLELDAVERLTGELDGFVTYDHETEEVLVHRAAVHQIGLELSRGDNRVVAIGRILQDAHSEGLVSRFLQLYQHWPLDGVAPPAMPGSNEGPSEAPSQAPSKPETEADAVSEPETASSSASSASTREVEDQVSEVIRAANRGLGDNPAISQFNPIHTGHASRQAVLDWLEEGIPTDVVATAVYSTAKDYQPDPPRHRQISTMNYFTGPVHEEWERAQAQNTEAPNGGQPRTNRAGRRRSGDTPQTFDYGEGSQEWDGEWTP